MRCEISPLATADLREIGDYIARDNPMRAESFVDELLEQCHKLTTMPLGSTARDDLAPGLRSCPYQRYMIFFTVTDTAVRIERIVHGSRDITNETYDDL